MDNTKPGIVVLDLETQRILDEVGGRQNINRLGLAVAVTYSTADETYYTYFEDSVAELITQLSGAPLIVGFDLFGFDYQVLQTYTNQRLAQLPTVDMLDYLYRHLGFRLSLDSLASASLGASKSSDGLQAVRWFREGKLDKVVEYCRQDVELTYRLYQFGKDKKFVQFRDRGALRKINVDW